MLMPSLRDADGPGPLVQPLKRRAGLTDRPCRPPASAERYQRARQRLLGGVVRFLFSAVHRFHRLLALKRGNDGASAKAPAVR